MDKTSYEICFWIKDDNTDIVPVGVLDSVKQMVLKLEGEVTSERLPEKRLLAYLIEKQRTAYWTANLKRFWNPKANMNPTLNFDSHSMFCHNLALLDCVNVFVFKLIFKKD